MAHPRRLGRRLDTAGTGAATGAWQSSTSIALRLEPLQAPLLLGITTGFGLRLALVLWRIRCCLAAVDLEITTSSGCVIKGLPRDLALSASLPGQDARLAPRTESPS